MGVGVSRVGCGQSLLVVQANIVAKRGVQLWIQVVPSFLSWQSLENIRFFLFTLLPLQLYFLLDVWLVFLLEIIGSVRSVVLFEESILVFGRGIKGHKLSVDSFATLRESFLAWLPSVDHLMGSFIDNLLKQFNICDNWLPRRLLIPLKPRVKRMIFLLYDASAHISLNRRPVMKHLIQLMVCNFLNDLHRPSFVRKQIIDSPYRLSLPW